MEEDATFFHDIHCFLLDMDGTLYLSDQAVPGAQAFTEYLSKKGFRFFCLTNNSSRNRLEYAEKLSRLGFKIPPYNILTSGDATAEILKNEMPGGRIFVVGTRSLEVVFEEHGFQLVDEDPEVIVLGFDTGLTYSKLDQLCRFVRAGYTYIATHPDLNCPTDQGPIPDIGATIAFVKAATGREPDRIIGKPNRPILEVVAHAVGISLDQICMVGDRLYTDIAFGRHGLKTILVLSGESTPDDVLESEFKPDLVVENVSELHRALQDLNN